MLSKYLKKYWFLITLTILLVAIQAIISLYLPDLMSDIVDKGITKGDTDYIWRVGGKMLLVSFISVIAAVLASYSSSIVSMGLGKDLREAIFKKVTSFSLEDMNKFSTSSLITRTTNDVTQIQQATIMILRMVVMAPVMAVGGIFMAIQKDAKLTSILLVSVPVMLLGLGIIAWIVAPLFKSMQKKIDKLNLVVRERVTGIRVIRAFNKEDYEKGRFSEANNDLTRTALIVNRISSVLFPYMMIVMNFTTIAIIWFGAKQIDAGTLQVGQMMAVMQYVMQIMFSFIMISVIFIFLPRASVSNQRIKEVLTTETKIKESENAIKVKSSPTWFEDINNNFKGIVEFDNVTFKYPGAAEPVLKNISFKALPGKITAIIGSTGSGKSTLLNLITRFYDVTSGSVKIDDIDIREIPFEIMRKNIGYATQKAFIFSGTIRENIRFGREWITNDMVENAADISQVLEFASKYPEGLDYQIDQAGLNLSGGQKQRISIARAIAGKPRIYLFDDTFSALDFKTDAKVRTRLFKETKDATVIIVAQRVATIMHADQIIVLKDGEIAGIGTHEELMKTSEVYQDIVYSQLSKEEIQ
ncbi:MULTISPECIES: ABC transporter ATP-binding protein [Fervidobacterium]|uniref:ABC transporter related n=1 Tax=Fervidobacterium nodosum (strain ATCC 35602 / DSM 5306 / Rt17-B1) TaxID=381764 RepID=A7HJD3_FERNB|nr:MULTISPECIES: ABC transporter ATP-binding protein [Fervidobacterium]ABS60016.1 ABC transporter related [Fervidobacterium nodosum Rt17-B1]KAF2961264.1 multidrug ABC transporter ATP-binding protein [Fervidobacterium sp. 2310opik-2]PHJ12493.1 multidrug ABC transporter ATP-binding protein [Fervidobacterium sp. SC_NGM5_G05]